MSEVAIAVVVLASLMVGLAVGWWLASRTTGTRLSEQEARLKFESDAATADLHRKLAVAEGQIGQLASDRESLTSAQQEAKTLDERLEPVRQALESLQRQTRNSDVERAKADTAIREQIQGVQKSYASLESATRQLVSAMTSSQSRGQWGEVQLERLLEYTGLVEGVHYRAQETRTGETGSDRPDIIIDLPGGGEILIDAKFPFDAYWKAIQAEDTGGIDTDEMYKRHASDVLAHAKALASRKYSAGSKSADFVVMFMPFESLLSAALDSDGELLHKAFSRNVTIATPTSLLPMLRTVVFGYDRRLMADNAEEIRRAGAEMLSRLETALRHLEGLRKGLTAAIKGYNEFVGSLDSRVIVQARKLQEMGVPIDAAIEAPQEIQLSVRELRASISTDSVEGSRALVADTLGTASEEANDSP